MGAGRLLEFVRGMTQLVEGRATEKQVMEQGLPMLAELVRHDDWLAEPFTRTHPQFYQQYLLYADPLDRLSIVSFVWGPGQKTPVHDHLTWGLVGGLRGRERETVYTRQADGSYKQTGSGVLQPGQTTAVSPTIGDVHEVANDGSEPAISIHVYGRNIGRVHRHVIDTATGAFKEFVSGYASPVVPNLWS